MFIPKQYSYIVAGHGFNDKLEAQILLVFYVTKI